MSVTTDTEVKATTFVQRAKALLCESDLITPAGTLVNERVQEVFHEGLGVGTGLGSLHAKITSDPNWARLNARQKAFLLAEIDLRNCPVKEGDTIEILVDRPDGAPFARGRLIKVRGMSDRGIATTEEGWVVSAPFYRLVTSLEFPADPHVDAVNYASVQIQANSRVGSFVTHSNDEGAWGSCECSVVMNGVDRAATWFDGRGIAGTDWSRTPEGKAWLGQVVRWMRAKVVAQWLDTQPMGAETPEETTHDAPAGSPNPEPVAVNPADVPVRREDFLRVQTERDALAAWKLSAERDFEMANEILNQQARDRDWCSEYESVLNSINRRCSVLQWEPRTRTVEVNVTGTVTRAFSVTVEIEVSGDDDIDDAARQYVDDNYGARSLFNDYYANDPEIEIEDTEVQ